MGRVDQVRQLLQLEGRHGQQPGRFGPLPEVEGGAGLAVAVVGGDVTPRGTGGGHLLDDPLLKLLDTHLVAIAGSGAADGDVGTDVAPVVVFHLLRPLEQGER